MPHPDSTLLTITHTHRDGTLLHGTTRHDGSADPLKAANWRWSRHLNSWYVPRSRDRHANQSLITHTQAALNAAGFEVHTTIDNTPRPFAEVNQDQLDRRSARADNLAATARELTTKAAQLAHQSDQLRSIWPTGQPLISPAAIRYHQRMMAAWDKAITAGSDAAQAQRRAETAAVGVRIHSNPRLVWGRIVRLTAELKRVEHHCPDLAASLREQLDHWQQVRADQLAAGTATAYGPDTVSVGDTINSRWVVERVNRASVTVRLANPGPRDAWRGTSRLPYHKITDWRPS